MDDEDMNSEEEIVVYDEEKLEELSDVQTDEEDQGPSANLGSADLVIPGVRKYKKSDQLARLTEADAKIEEIKESLDAVAAKLIRKKTDREKLLAEQENFLIEMEDWKKKKLQARNAVNQRRRQIKVREKYGTEKQKLLDEKDKKFAKKYTEAYAALEGAGCDHRNLQYKKCKLCMARLLFGNLTCLTVKSDKAFEESQKPNESDRSKNMRIKAETPEEVSSIKKERRRVALRKFRERQKKMIQGMDERLKFFEDSNKTFQKFYNCLPSSYKDLSFSTDEQSLNGQPFMINCVREFAATLAISIPKFNIYLDSEEFLESFIEYLSETFLLTLNCPFGFEEVEEEHCAQCDRQTIKEKFHRFIAESPTVEKVNRFRDIVERYGNREETLHDCQNCAGKNSLKRSRYYTMRKEQSKYALVCLPKGSIFFPRDVELIFNTPMELVFFITLAGHFYRPFKKNAGEWFIHVDGNWVAGQLPRTCVNVLYVVFQKLDWSL